MANSIPICDGAFSTKQSLAFGESPLDFLTTQHKRYGDLFYAMIGVKKTLIVGCPLVAREILQNDIEFELNFNSRKIFKDVLGASQGLSTGTLWESHNNVNRRIFNVKNITESVSKDIDIFQNEIERYYNKSKVSKSLSLLELIKQSVLKASFSFLQYEPKQEEIDFIIHFYDFFIEHILAQSLNPFSRKNIRADFEDFKRKIPTFHLIVQQVIQSSKHPLIEGYIQHPSLKKSHLIDQLSEIIVTSYGTVVFGIYSTLVYLKKNKKYEDLVRQEVTSDISSPLDVFNFKFLRLTLYESLRLNPPAFIIPRITTSDTTISKQYSLKKGQEVIINLLRINTNESFWEEPNKFIPERFENLRTEKVQLYSYFMPFGFGKRICPGRNLALQEALLFIATLYQNYSFDFKDCPPSDSLRAVLSVMHEDKPISLKNNIAYP